MNPLQEGRPILGRTSRHPQRETGQLEDGRWKSVSDERSMATAAAAPPREDRSEQAHRGAALTLAVINLSSSTPADPGALARAAHHLELLKPDAIVVLGDIGMWRARAGWQTLQKKLLASVESPDLFMLPDRYVMDTAAVAIRQLLPSLFLLYVRSGAAEKGAIDGPAATWETGLDEKLEAMPDSASIVCLVDQPIWEDKESDVWPRLAKRLRQSTQNVVMVSGGGERFSWWEDEDVSFITMPCLADQGWENPNLGRGEFTGYLWGHFTPETGMRFAVLMQSGMVDLKAVSREQQLVVKQLIDSLQSTAADDLNPVTYVTLTNPTSSQLQFQTRWQFQQADVIVSPRIVEFELGPGQTFKQQFRFEYGSGRRLKYLNPTLTLTTRLKMNGRHPVEISTSPWTRVVGTVDLLTRLPTLDGIPETEGLTGHEIGQPVQVVEGRDHWNGPGDISGRVFAGLSDDALYLGIKVTDDEPAAALGRAETKDSVTIYADLRSPETRATQQSVGNGQLLGIHVARDGKIRTLIGEAFADATMVEVTVAEAQDGYGVELMIPRSLFENSLSQGPLRFDVMLSDEDTAEEPVKRLFLSGKAETPFPDPNLFAVFALPEAPEEAPAE